MGWFETKSEKIERLENEIVSLHNTITSIRDEKIEAQIANSRAQSGFNASLESHRSLTEIKVAQLTRDLEIAKASLKTSISDGIVKEKRDLERQKEVQEKEHKIKMAKLEAEHVAKIAKHDVKLEEAKASYRKYFRQEHNTKMEMLEKQNANLVKENAELRGENVGLTASQKFFSGKQEGFETVMNNLINALPTISASFTTPEVNVSVPGSASTPKQNGGVSGTNQKN